MEQLLGGAVRALWNWLTTPVRTLLADAICEALARHGGDCEVLRWGPIPEDLELIYTGTLTDTDLAKRPE